MSQFHVLVTAVMKFQVPQKYKLTAERPCWMKLVSYYRVLLKMKYYGL